MFSIAMATTLALGVLAGCSSNTSETGGTAEPKASSNQEVKAPVKLKYLVPGVESRDNKEVMNLINKKLAADGVGVEIEKVFIPSDAWDQKINLMLSTGEEFDLFHVMQDRTPYSTYWAKGALADISQAVDKYGSHLKKVIPQDIWDGSKADGKTVVIPAYWVEMASEGEFDIRLDILKQNNLQMPKTPDEMLQTLEVVMKNWKGKNKPYLTGNAQFDPISFHTTVLHRAYDSFPFTVKDKFIYVNQNGDIKSWIETPEFKKDAEFMRKAYTKGLLNPDMLVLKNEQVKAQIDNGEWFISFGTAGNLSSLKKNNPDAVNTDISAVYFNPEKPYLRPLSIKNANAVPITSKHVDDAVKFMDWVYAGQDNYDLIQYGIEGKHYKKDGDRGLQKINDPSNDNKPGYSGSESQLGNVNLIRTDNVNGIPSNNQVLYTRNEKAQNSIVSNFLFDPTPVKAEYANSMTEAASSITPIYMGILDYDKAFPAALEKMKKAGLDKVVQEYVKQYKEWKAKSANTK
ncbi:extracellular solute-binding protein [Paenibacillus sp. Soil766]|uniref:extracellular solute-binding protein n=1 Tax=Paenibacillus sp. Soil766 TaxID=1736404 RepID=UPI001F33D4E3|nr:extracellular solute-binding protein [Paenibacillus sp. Soil766]